MHLKTYDEVDPDAVMRLNAMAFNWYLDDKTARKIRKLDPACADWFALYVEDEGEIRAQVGVSYPRLMTAEGEVSPGFVWGVATHPGHARKGYQKALFEAVHSRMLEDGADLFVLMTLRSFVAHSLYEKYGYEDFIGFKWGIRQARSGPPSNLRVEKKAMKSPEVANLFRRASEGRPGFTLRNDNFI
ncbi:MAG: GNAT family N-acetyltransferase, partial [Candidatus Dadabacteria bacterium]|nr:GNAT family N-acetyltransferase [Candidatus Dadabacteria bacterium]